MPIFDQGYQHWKGPLAGHAWRWLAIARHGVRVQLKSWIVRGLLILAWMPAIGLIGAVAIWGLIEQKSAGVLNLVSSLLPADMLLDPHAYRTTAWTLAYYYFFATEMYLIMLMVVVVGPGLISRDLRFNALPLYFSRPLTRSDYFIGKLGVIGTLVAAVAVGPAVLAYLVGICFSFDLSVVKDTYRILLASIAYGIIITLAVGALMLALSSLSRRSLYVGLMWFGISWISAAVGGILNGFYMESVRLEILQGDEAYQEAQAEIQKLNVVDAKQETPAERNARMQRIGRLHREAFERSLIGTEERMAEAARSNWRSLPSFTANLDRLGHGLLDTDAAWLQIGLAVEQGRQAVERPMRLFSRGGPRMIQQPINERRLANTMVPHYPWWWSASVLAGLMGISAWILSRRVKSLDRLK